MQPTLFEFFDMNMPNIEVPDGLQLLYYKDRTLGRLLLHSHNFIEIMMVMQGDISISHEGILYPMEPGDVCIVTQDQFHRSIIHESTRVYERHVIHLASDYLENIYEKYSSRKFKHLSFDIPLVLDCNAEDTAYVKFLLNRIALNYSVNDEFSTKIIQSLIYEMLCFFERKHLSTQSESTPLSNKVVEDIIEYINTHYTSSDIKVSDIADEFYISQGYLSKLFKRFTGTTVYNYILEKRLDYSKQLMDSGWSVEDSCYVSGFSDYTSYLKAFKKLYNKTPSEYKWKKDAL